MTLRKAFALLVAPLLLAPLACGGSSDEGPITGTRARFDLRALTAANDDFYGLPFPSDLRSDGIGLNLAAFPNPEASGLLDDYVNALYDSVPGFGSSAAMYVQFSGALDPSTIPTDPAATLATDSPIQLIDLGDLGKLAGQKRDDDSTIGARLPLKTKWFGPATLFVHANTLALLPVPGMPLLPRHTYALVLTDDLKDSAHASVVADEATRRALGVWTSSAATKKAEDVTMPFVSWAKASGYPLSHVVLASVFTVQDSTGPMIAVRDAVHAQPQPTPNSDFAYYRTTSKTFVFTGTFPVANFQQGTVPYLHSGGAFQFDASGKAIVQRTEQVRFALTIPKGPSPTGGFPLVLYAHGTGGSYLSCSDEGLADSFAALGLATLTMDQVMHGPRNPTCDESSPSYETCVGLDYFNFFNPYAGRDNTRQGGADGFMLTRLAHVLNVPAPMHPQAIATSLETDHFVFVGHSQGGLTGAPYVAAETELAGAVFSGTGGVLAITVLQRKDPVDFKALAESLLNITGKEELEPFHPVLALVQTFIEPADPLNYARHFQQRPLSSGPRDLLIFEGLLDQFTPAETSEAFGAAARVDIGGTLSHAGPAYTLLGLANKPLPLSGNIALGATPRTGALLQFPNNDHFAIFDNPQARCRMNGFVQSAFSGTATIPACP
ncbi:MAG: hypothetical protein JST92_13265 [Deltaproteobacteria bacterium]|nr:hypothetical protein [Deltaproteobacteria bacterium]